MFPDVLWDVCAALCCTSLFALLLSWVFAHMANNFVFSEASSVKMFLRAEGINILHTINHCDIQIEDVEFVPRNCEIRDFFRFKIVMVYLETPNAHVDLPPVNTSSTCTWFKLNFAFFFLPEK